MQSSKGSNDTTHHAQKTAEHGKETLKSAASDVSQSAPVQAAKESASNVASSAGQTVDQAKSTASEYMQPGQSKLRDVSQSISQSETGREAQKTAEHAQRTLAAGMSATTEGVASAACSAKDSLAAAATSAKDAIQNPSDTLASGASKIQETGIETAKQAQDYIGSAANYVKGTVTSVKDTVLSTATSARETASSTVQTARETVTKTTKNVVESDAVFHTKKCAEHARDAVVSGVIAAKDTGVNIVGSTTSYVKDTANSVINRGVDAVHYVENVVESGVSGAKGVVQDALHIRKEKGSQAAGGTNKGMMGGQAGTGHVSGANVAVLTDAEGNVLHAVKEE